MADSLRLRLARALDPEMRGRPGISGLNRAILGLIVASILVGVAETEPMLRAGRESWFALAEEVFLVAFAAEFAGRLWTAGLNPKRGGALGWLLTPAALVDLLVIVTMAVPLIGVDTSLLRLFRAARLLRLARLGRYSTAMRLLTEAVASRREELAVSVVFALCLLLISSTLLYVVEGAVQPDRFGSIPRAMWWSVATLTTVGYGDVVPVTVLGRMLAAVTALTGIGLIALPTGILAGAFGDAMRAARDARQGGNEPPGES